MKSAEWLPWGLSSEHGLLIALEKELHKKGLVDS
jgi:hypothetical protein